MGFPARNNGAGEKTFAEAGKNSFLKVSQMYSGTQETVEPERKTGFESRSLWFRYIEKFKIAPIDLNFPTEENPP